MNDSRLEGDPPRIRDWEQTYRDEPVEEMPWFFADLDADFGAAIEAHGITSAKVLDLGSGPGTQAIALAKRGFQVTATDISPTAIDKATQRAADEGVTIEFLVDDIRATRIEPTFDLILDRGCFHVLDPDQRSVYVRAVARLLSPGGRLMLKTFSHHQPGDEGPHRFEPDQIVQLFAADFAIDAVEHSTFQGNHDPPPKALFCVLQRRA